MNNILKKQIEGKLDKFFVGDNHIVIPKQGDAKKDPEVASVVQMDKNYIIQLKNYILNPPENFTLEANWNRGIRPQSEFLAVTLIKTVGKMYCFDGRGYDYLNNTSKDDSYISLWLPEKGFSVIREIK